jgi:type I restriction enzyme S subunit
VSDWPTRRLGDVLAEPLTNGRSVPTQDGGFPVLRLTALRENGVDLRERKEGAWTREDAERFLVRRGDFLVARGNGSLHLVGRGALINVDPDEVAYPDTMIRIRADVNVLLPRYLDLVWQSPGVRTQIESSARTTAGIYKVNQRHLEAIQVPVPDLNEQSRVVDILEDHLSRLDAANASVTAASKRLRTLQERAVLDTITGADRSGERLACQLADVGTHDGELPDLPKGWCWSRLGEVAEVVGGVTKDAKKQDDPRFVEVPYLRVANVQRGHLDLRNVTHIRVDSTKAEALRLRPGDVLLNEGGDRDKLARGWVWEGQIEDCIHQNHVFRARIHDPRIDPYFLSWTANSIGGQWAERNGKQSVNLASISLSMIRRMPVIVPPAREAEAALERLRETLNSLRRLQAALTHAKQQSATLRRSLLAAAFSGQLTSYGIGPSRIEAPEVVGV